MHPLQGAKLKKRFTGWVAMWARRSAPMGWVPLSQFTVHVHFCCRNRRTDPDNILGRLKYILDGLQAAEIILGDGWSNVVAIVPTWTVDKNRPGVTVTLMGE